MNLFQGLHSSERNTRLLLPCRVSIASCVFILETTCVFYTHGFIPGLSLEYQEVERIDAFSVARF